MLRSNRFLPRTDTNADCLPTDHQIIMVDGTVPDWVAKPGDLHWDHHPGGADI
ncbi:hypothetical protein H6G20_05275 [Desertifilum sp. FACHB-1129]|uniref:hypothetical protein n=1 Tax=unclassified Desertifilum TaxID=2621682 RepID=UPI0016856A50|nr:MULTISPECIES: hypothetical protein [unclassified Desertifilum]MBD2311095.1 hypothetical protein [Desertifilum sp. FACHB-1129]MBD2323962.1 hypothetical protein [Desertifilum sp. FACHB-866]MBD2333897.1 hypothetical protein [Desertifilum sp. FACHB-868]MDA0211208.1 hypothetical protein [Cyanobacteria bacterium FC1]